MKDLKIEFTYRGDTLSMQVLEQSDKLKEFLKKDFESTVGINVTSRNWPNLNKTYIHLRGCYSISDLATPFIYLGNTTTTPKDYIVALTEFGNKFLSQQVDELPDRVEKGEDIEVICSKEGWLMHIRFYAGEFFGRKYCWMDGYTGEESNWEMSRLIPWNNVVLKHKTVSRPEVSERFIFEF